MFDYDEIIKRYYISTISPSPVVGRIYTVEVYPHEPMAQRVPGEPVKPAPPSGQAVVIVENGIPRFQGWAKPVLRYDVPIEDIEAAVVYKVMLALGGVPQP